jgi:hypothetical protein
MSDVFENFPATPSSVVPTRKLRGRKKKPKAVEPPPSVRSRPPEPAVTEIDEAYVLAEMIRLIRSLPDATCIRILNALKHLYA